MNKLNNYNNNLTVNYKSPEMWINLMRDVFNFNSNLLLKQNLRYILWLMGIDVAINTKTHCVLSPSREQNHWFIFAVVSFTISWWWQMSKPGDKNNYLRFNCSHIIIIYSASGKLQIIIKTNHKLTIIAFITE